MTVRKMSEYFDFGYYLSHPFDEDDEIVISGISGQFPCSGNVNELYKNLLAKRNLVVDMDGVRLNTISPGVPKKAGLINEIDKFDCGLFGLHYNDAQNMNPLSRIYMEETLKAIMDAGVHPEELEGTKTGVFTSVSGVFYQRESKLCKTEIYRNLMSTTISHFLKTEGPSYSIDAACSASGTSLEHAFRALRTGECDYAIVGGGNILQHPGNSVQLWQYGVLTLNGECKVFDENADGYVRSEGVACLFLQKRKTARRIYARIIHTKTNFDGYCAEGITFPSAEAQGKLIKELQNEACTNPDDLDFCEFHGTGTKVGDEQELKGVYSAISQRRSKPLLIGSVKSSLGHTEGPSGLISIIKVLLASENGILPPNINLKTLIPNSKALMSGRLVVATEPTPLPPNSLVAINNFGLGGANAHTLLQGITESRLCKNLFPRIVCASGRSPEAIKLLLSKVDDSDYASLLDQLFARNYANFPYRGYVILREDYTSDETVSLCSYATSSLIIEFGHISSVDNEFLSHPLVREFIKVIMKNLLLTVETLDMENYNQTDDLHNLILNLCLVELIKKLDLKPTTIQGNCLVCAYYEEKISLEEILLAPINHSLTLSHNTESEIKNGTALTSNDLVSNFYETVGRLYLKGFNPQIKNLYPTQFPVGRGTPSISALLKFHHNKSWKTSLYGTYPSHIHTMDFKIDLKRIDYQYLSGYVVDSQIIFPAIGYCYLAWQLLALNKQAFMADVPVIFENCRFMEALLLNENTPTKLSVTLSRGTGKYEIVNNEDIVSCGTIYIGREETSELDDTKIEENEQFMDQQEIYKAFQLRGYEYSAPFKSLMKYNIRGNGGLAKWEESWVPFLDSMLQTYLLTKDTQTIYLPTCIRRMSIDPERHYKSLGKSDQKVLFRINKECSFLSSEGVKMQGLSVSPIYRQPQINKPVLDKYVFTPNEWKTDFRDSVLINLQIIRENFRECKLKCLKLISGLETPLITEIEKILETTIGSTMEFSKSSKDDLGGKNGKYEVSSSHLIIGRRLLHENDVLSNSIEVLKPGGFLLSLEKSDSNIKTRDLEIITIHSIADSKFILCRKLDAYWPNEFIIIPINAHLNWLAKLQEARDMDQNVILLSESKDPNGLLGLFRCLRREPSVGKLLCFICGNTSQFPNEFHKKQLSKQLSVNIYRNGKWGTFRYLPLEENPEIIKSVHCHITTQLPGDISNLKWFQAPKPSPGETVEIYCSGLNFKDIVIANGKLNLKKKHGLMDYPIGTEFAGRDSRGKRVMGLVLEGGLGTSVQIQKDRTIEIPHHWSYEDAATVPVVYMSVLYSLLMRIKLNKNMSVLIDSGAGDVGLAAINIASYYGCKIFVTVDSEEKRRFLKDNYPQLVDNRIGNSVVISFEQWIKTETGGRGVDVILNSLSEEKIQASIQCLAEGGTFLDLGNYDLVKNNPLALELMKDGKCYQGIMLDLLYETNFAEEEKELLELVKFGIKNGFVKPLPRTVFKREKVHEAFRLMMCGKHIGKVVVKIREENEPKLELNVLPRFYAPFHRCCSYIIIGGLGGMGLELADWLISRGATNIVINSRNGIKTGYQAFRINCWKSNGIVVEISSHDVTTREGCFKLINEAQSLGPVDGIFNLAVVLQDALLPNQTKESFENVLGPKSVATQYLDAVSRKYCHNLRYFVVFSSLSCGFGNAGQSNYGMANSIMEYLCEDRKKEGFPALAIQWGPIANVGVLADIINLDEIAEKWNVVPQKISSCLEVLDRVLHQDHAIVSSLIPANKKTNGANKSAVEAVLQALGVKNVSHQATLAELGMDSMKSVEIMRILETDFQIFLTVKLNTLTLARLSVLEDEEKHLAKNYCPKSIERSSRMSHLFAPKPTTNSLVTIKETSGSKIFLFPGDNGDLEMFKNVCQQLEATVYGLQYNYYEPEDTIEEIALNLMRFVKEKLDKDEYFIFAGFCFGSLIALHIAHLLEKEGYSGKLILIEGSPDYVHKLIKSMTSFNGAASFEDSFIMSFLNKCLATTLTKIEKDELASCSNIQGRIDKAFDLLPKSTKFEKQALFCWYKRSAAAAKFSGDFSCKMNYKVTLIKATIPSVNNSNFYYGLEKICNKDVAVLSVEGDHTSILGNMQLVHYINEVLSDNS